MRIYVMTDMEGIAGVISSDDYCSPDSRYYELGRKLTTEETNAAILGALDAGATEILVVDGHGPGAINPDILHPAARLLAGRPLTFPFGCDYSFDAAFIVGQHAKANTNGGHLCHTGAYSVDDLSVNGRSIGELGMNMLIISSFGVPTVLVTGDQACCDEAISLVSGVETVAVKEGLKRGSAAGLSAERARYLNSAAVHLHADVARRRIRQAASRALRRRTEIGRFWIDPPYEIIRADRIAADGAPGQRWRQLGNDLPEVLRKPAEPF